MRRKILDQKGINFLTMTVVDWIDLFTRKVYCDIIIDSLKYCIKEKGLIVYGYVIMPSHLHLIFQAQDEKDLSVIIKEFKSFTARQIINYIKNSKNIESRRKWLLAHFMHHGKDFKNVGSQNKVWMKGNYPTLVYSPFMIWQKLHYIHRNPMVAGIVPRPEYYCYSSALEYEVRKEGKRDFDGLLEIKFYSAAPH